MKNIKNIFLFFIALFLFNSCYEDKGNYSYKEIEEAVIKAIPGVTNNNDKLVCFKNQTITLNPELEFKGESSESDFKYIWFRYPQDPQGTSFHYEQADTIAQTKDLNYKVIDDPRDFWLVYKVINKKTKAVFEKKFQFIISKINGLLVLDENSLGEGDLNIIRDKDLVINGDGSIVRNCFSEFNDGQKILKGKFIGVCPYSGQNRLMIYSEEGAYLINSSNYELLKDKIFKDLFTFPLNTINPQAQMYDYNGGNTELLLNNGKLYSVSYRSMGASKKNEISTDDQNFAPFIAPIQTSGASNCALVFDNNSKGFYSLGTWGNLATIEIEGAEFNPANLGDDSHLVYLGEGKDSETCAVVNNNDDYYLYRVNCVEENPVVVGKIDITSLADIANADFFTFGLRANMMFYATDNNVYCYNFTNTSSSNLFSVESGETIVDMIMYNNNTDDVFNGKILFVATYKNNEGKVYKITFDELTGMFKSSLEYKGFGKIKNMFFFRP